MRMGELFLSFENVTTFSDSRICIKSSLLFLLDHLYQLKITRLRILSYLRLLSIWCFKIRISTIMLFLNIKPIFDALLKLNCNFLHIWILMDPPIIVFWMGEGILDYYILHLWSKPFYIALRWALLQLLFIKCLNILFMMIFERFVFLSVLLWTVLVSIFGSVKGFIYLVWCQNWYWTVYSHAIVACNFGALIYLKCLCFFSSC